ncbi:hypothetical protein [Leucobacter luti]|uniref:hypothetical protein n=1 Tax=Leucobacter luti TaxID=340320 RepID=UPI00105C679B|nr:hypothetical protein [Leucobacter luti]
MRLKEHVKKLITNPDPDPDQEIETVRAIPIDGEEGGEYRVVFGVGAFTEPQIQMLETLSDRTLTIQDLLEDSLDARRPTLDPSWVLKHGIPGHLRPTKIQYVPVYSFLDRAGRVAPDGNFDYSGLDPIIQSLAEREIKVMDSIVNRFERVVSGVFGTPSELMAADLRLYSKLELLPLLAEESTSNLEEFRVILSSLVKDGHDELNGYNSSNLKRAVCQYERLALASKRSKHADEAVRP